MFVVIVTWKRPVDLLHCIGSIHDESAVQGIIVVNNSPAFDTLESVTAAYPKAKVIASAENLGYAGGNNAGIRCALEAGAQTVLVLNDDALLAKDALSLLLSAAIRHPDAGFLGPVVYSLEDDRVLLSAGGKLANGSVIHTVDDPSAVAPKDVVAVDFLSGCALLVRREAIIRVGLLDERFFLYHEDVDWCYRARQAGLPLLLVPEARVFHPDTRLRDADSAPLTYYMTRNRLLFIQKHNLGVRTAASVLLSGLVLAASWSLRPRWRSKRAQRDALVYGLLDHMMGKYGRSTRKL